MTRQEFGFVAARLGAVLIAVQAVAPLISVFSMLTSGAARETQTYALISAGGALAYIGVAILLWGGASTFGGPSSETSSASPVSALQILNVGLVLLGIYVSIQGLTQVLQYVATPAETPGQVLLAPRVEWLSGAARLAIGIILVIVASPRLRSSAASAWSVDDSGGGGN